MKFVHALSLLSSLSLLGSCFFLTRQLRCDDGAAITCSDDGKTQLECNQGELTFTDCINDDSCTEGVGCAPQCGNGQIDADEDCDGLNVDDQDCADVDAATTGELACNDDCTFNTDQCIPAGCDNDDVAEPGEACDGTDIDSCNVLTSGDLPQGTASCNNCIVDTSNCSNCGDNVLQGGETCDDGCGGNGCNNGDNGDGCNEFCQTE
jgi:hypothetical protein